MCWVLGEFGDDPNRYTDARKLMRLIIPHVIIIIKIRLFIINHHHHL